MAGFVIVLLCPAKADADPAAVATVGVLLFRYVQEHSDVVRVSLGSHTPLQHLIEVDTQNVASDHTPLAGSAVLFEIAGTGS